MISKSEWRKSLGSSQPFQQNEQQSDNSSGFQDPNGWSPTAPSSQRRHSDSRVPEIFVTPENLGTPGNSSGYYSQGSASLGRNPRGQRRNEVRDLQVNFQSLNRSFGSFPFTHRVRKIIKYIIEKLFIWQFQFA